MTTLVDPSFVQFATQLADAARKITLKYFRQPLDIHSKDDRSPVTIADQETEACMRALILQQFPQHGFYGEESGQHQSNAEWTWVIDPIDGTSSFSTGKPTFGTLIALLYHGHPVLGVIDHAALDDRWVGAEGQKTTFNGVDVSCNQVSDLKACSAFTTTTKMFDAAATIRYQALVSECKFGVFGGDCMGYGLLASGFTEIVVEASLQPYDYMAVAPVVTGAGGVITDWEGQAITLQTGDQILATANPVLHNKVLQQLRAERVVNNVAITQ